VARSLHLIAVLCLLAMKWVFGLEILYLVGVTLVTIILIYEHTLVSEDDLSKVNIAFFSTNGVISVVYFLFTMVDVLIIGW